MAARIGAAHCESPTAPRVSMAQRTVAGWSLLRTSTNSFAGTILEKVDFRTAFNYSIDLERNRIKKARFSAKGVVGLLDKYDIDID